VRASRKPLRPFEVNPESGGVETGMAKGGD